MFDFWDIDIQYTLVFANSYNLDVQKHLDLDQVPLQVLHFFHKNEMFLQSRCKKTCIEDIEMTISMAR